MKVSLHPLAAADLAAAAAFYRRNASVRLEARFVTEFERVARLLVERPDLGTPFDLPRRTYPLRHFPYSIVYRPTDRGIRVLIVRHQRRAPAFGTDRV